MRGGGGAGDAAHALRSWYAWLDVPLPCAVLTSSMLCVCVAHVCRLPDPVPSTYTLSAVEVMQLLPGRPVDGYAPMNGLAFFVFSPPSDVTTIRIELVSMTGDADLFVNGSPFRPEYIMATDSYRCHCFAVRFISPRCLRVFFGSVCVCMGGDVGKTGLSCIFLTRPFHPLPPVMSCVCMCVCVLCPAELHSVLPGCGCGHHHQP